MSYARFGNSDVYVFMHVNGKLCCCACIFAGVRFEDPDYWGDFFAENTYDMVKHLMRHKRKGDQIPSGIIDDLWEDDEENFPKQDDNDHL